MSSFRISAGACLAGLAMVAVPVPAHAHRATPAIRLEISAATVPPPTVTVTAIPKGIWVDSTSGGVHGQLTVRTPVVIDVADSVQSLHVAVRGAGSVALSRIFQKDAAGWGGAAKLAPVGRDITLRRGADGQFKPVVTVHPAGP